MADRKGQTTPNQEGDSTSTTGNPDRDNQSGQGTERQGTERQGRERQGNQTPDRTGTEQTETERTTTDIPERSDRTSEEGSNI